MPTAHLKGRSGAQGRLPRAAGRTRASTSISLSSVACRSVSLSHRGPGHRVSSPLLTASLTRPPCSAYHGPSAAASSVAACDLQWP